MPTYGDPFLDVLDVLPIYLRDLVLAIARKRKVDARVVLPTLLSGMASAVHGLKFALRPDGGVEYLGMFNFVLARTTAGKSESYKLVFKPHIAHDTYRYVRHKEGKKSGNNSPLRDVIQPLTNSRLLLESLDGVGHATTVCAHDGKGLLDCYFMRHQLSLANVLWDGGDKVVVPLSNGNRLIVIDGNLNFLCMVQPDIYRLDYERRGVAAHDVGFIPRCLFTIVHDCRFQGALPEPSSDSCLEEYYKDVTAYLDAQLKKQEESHTEREGIRFSQAAANLWAVLEMQIRENAAIQYPRLQETMNRAMQNVTRVAAVIHAFYPHRPDDARNDHTVDTFAGRTDEISVHTLRAAWAIVQWHLAQFAELFPPPPPPPSVLLVQKPKARDKLYEDADVIMHHFAVDCGPDRSRESSALKSNVYMRTGLYRQRFNAALFHLTDRGYLVVEGKGEKTRLKAGPNKFVPYGSLNERDFRPEV